jgi:hypothetical protein
MKFCLTDAGMCEAIAFPRVDSFQQINHIERILEKVRSGVKIIVDHVERHKVVYRIGALTLIVLLGGVDMVSAAAEGTIDENAGKLYYKLIGIGKWIILIKGGFDTLSATVQGDFPAARKSGLAYMLVYVILLGLPWAFNQIELLFNEVT